MKKNARPPRRAKRIDAPKPTTLSRAPVADLAASSREARTTERPFPIVGIGASAGGLEALEQFFRNVPEHSGMAYVVVLHLDPANKGAMVELLQRASKIPVVQVKDRQRVRPDCVFVIPANKDLSILHGVLHLSPQTAPRGLNLPIDFFFRSLADDQQERGIGVVLSGMASDGTLGLRAIKEKAGAAFVQSLATAKFTGMPRSAMEAGLADVVASAEQLPQRIAAYLHHAPHVTRPDAPFEETQASALENICVLLRAHTGNDFSLYKRSTLYRRIERRMALHQIDKIGTYVGYLRENAREVELLFSEVLIGVTSFFRDPDAWEHLRKRVLPELLRSRPADVPLRAWVPGCSTGEEAYSLAIVLSEAIEAAGRERRPFQIFATDIDYAAIDRARQGIFPANIAADVSPERLRRYFAREDGGFRVRNEIREAVVFAPQNLIMDPPFTKLDVLSCRNLLIYLAPELQKKLIPLFHYGLNPGGVLFLGNAETVGAYRGLFSAADGKTRLYRRIESPLGAPQVEFPPTFVAPSRVPRADAAESPDESKIARPNFPAVAERLILERLQPAAILTNDKAEILYISGRTGKYLEPATGAANLNVLTMAREGLRYELSGAFARALREDGPVVVRALRVQTNGHTQSVDLGVERVLEPKELRGMVLITLTDVAEPPAPAEERTSQRSRTSGRVADLERALAHSHAEIQTTREEMQTSQEELKSTNEELQSTNEELQSTNEELTTSKEEMQSMNEELQTVNHELQMKVDELSRSNNDMKNLLNSTDIATLFLDGHLLVRRFTTQTSKLIKLLPADAGRPITDLATNLDYPGLSEDAREVLRTLVYKETQVATRDGRWFAVRILPYRTLENVIDGVVITFTDTTAAKTLEAQLRDQAERLQQMTESLPALMWVCRPDGTCDYVTRRCLEYTGVSEGEHLGYGWLDQVHVDDRERIREDWRVAVRTGAQLDREFRVRGKDRTYRWFKGSFAPIRDTAGAIGNWYCTCTDIDDLKRVTDQLASTLEGIDEAFIAADERLVVRDVNAAAEHLFGRKRADVIGKALHKALPASVFPDEKLRAVIKRKRSLEYDVPFRARNGSGPLAIRVFPSVGGVSIFCKRQSAGIAVNGSRATAGKG